MFRVRVRNLGPVMCTTHSFLFYSYASANCVLLRLATHTHDVPVFFSPAFSIPAFSVSDGDCHGGSKCPGGKCPAFTRKMGRR